MVKKSSQKRKVIDIYPPHSIIEKEQNKEKKPTSPKTEEVLIHINRFRTQVEEYYPGEPAGKENIKEGKVAKKEIAPLPSSLAPRWLKIGGILIFAFAIYYLGFVAFVRANVSIVTKKITLPFSGVVLSDRNVSEVKYSQGVIPANLLVFSESAKKTFVSTGRGKDEMKAKGIITIYNNYSTSPQILVAITRFETPDHKIFRLDSRVVVPGASQVNGKLSPSSIDVKVTADKAGPDYNISACNLPDCKFTIPGFAGSDKFKGFYGISREPMKEGSFSSIPMITSEDTKSAENAIVKTLMETIGADAKNKVPTDLTVLEGAKSSINITKVGSDASVGDERQNFIVKGEGEVKIIAFKKENLNDYIQSQLGEKKDENYEYYEAPKIEFQGVKPNFDKGTLKLTIQAKQQLRFHLDSQDLKTKILGKRKDELNSLFQDIPGIEQADVKIRPFWITKIPSAPSRVNVSID